MTSSVLNRMPPSVRLSPLQSQVDGVVGGFTEQATDWRALAALTAGGLAYRAGRVGLLGVGSGSALRVASVGLGLSAEVSTFEISHRALQPQNPQLWRWNGNGGLARGLLQSFISFGALKGAGHLGRGENFIAQHLFQDTAMVFGHRTAAALGLAPLPSGSLAEEFLHAEAMNLQVSAGMALGQGITAGRLHAMERGLDLSLQVQDTGRRPRPLVGRGPFLNAEPAWLGPSASSLESSREDPKREGLVFSSSLPPRSDSPRFDPFGLGERTNLENIIGEGKAVRSEFLNALIRSILQKIPSGLSPMELILETGQPSHQLVLEGRLHHRRLEALHRLLAGDRDLKELSVIDNAPGNILDLAFTLARLGSSVVLKEPGELESSLHREILRTLPLREIAERIRQIPEKAIDIHTPADIVYWTNPCLFRLERPVTAPLGDYLGRDVKVGGYLVLQSDHLMGQQEELLQLDLNPQEWETVFDEDLPNFYPKANYLLPTTQANNSLHVQVYRRKADLPVTASPEIKGPDAASTEVGTSGAGFPYVEGERGVFLPAKANSQVVVLGDVAGTRTYELASQGHRVIHIDRDFSYLEDARNYVDLKFQGARMRGQAPEKLDIDFLQRDWLTTSAQADLVEAFYPLDFRDVPIPPGAARDRALTEFLEKAMNTKIRRGGTGFIISEHSDLISDLAFVVEKDPRLEILEEQYQQKWIPIEGGYGTVGGIPRNSWLIYRRK